MQIKKNNNPFAGKAKTGTGKKKGSGKRVGKSKPGKGKNNESNPIEDRIPGQSLGDGYSAASTVLELPGWNQADGLADR